MSSTITWEQALRGFARIHLKPGESKTISFALAPDSLAIWNAAMQRGVEPGKYQVQVGASSADIRLEGEFEIERRAGLRQRANQHGFAPVRGISVRSSALR